MNEESTLQLVTPARKGPIHLFCLPNAGGSALVYAQWKALLYPTVHLHLVELAGRGRRFQDSLYDNMSDVVEDLYRRIEPHLDVGEFAFFGHSMGALICYELIGQIWSRRNQAPLHAFISGRVTPDYHEPRQLHRLSDEDLLAETVRWGGLSEQHLADEALIRMLLPILRADFKMLETYNLQFHRLPCPISILRGTSDTIVQPERVQLWANFTTQSCSFYDFPGGHFYLNECKEQVVSLINRVLSTVVRSSSSYFGQPCGK